MSYMDNTNVRPSTRIENENIFLFSLIFKYKMLDEEEENFTLHVIRHLMCQIVKRAEDADAAYEFITNLANNLKPKLVREKANYLMSESNIALDRESKRVVQETIENSNQGRNIVSYCSCMHYVIGNT
ncbi:hypothetical protein V1477_001529 [Vespula maculifrons]|uniref:Uncharacterized protein n=1 Tax=Vespula maculifrons TaxID=7453 RepID=A0ABD2CYT1_VESMC